MRELIVNTFLTLDGVMQAPGCPEEDPSGGFEHGGWSFGYWDEQMQRAMGESMSKPFDLVLGRKTYEIFAAHWPHTDDPGPSRSTMRPSTWPRPPSPSSSGRTRS
jgi:dihydrofolate reductase